MDNEMLKQAAYGTIAGHVANALITHAHTNIDNIAEDTVKITKAIVDKLYA